jgi:hypothetical protein
MRTSKTMAVLRKKRTMANMAVARSMSCSQMKAKLNPSLHRALENQVIALAGKPLVVVRRNARRVLGLGSEQTHLRQMTMMRM